MTIHRFFIPSHCFKGHLVWLTPEISHQISRVLRLKVGDTIVVLDGQGEEYQVKLSSIKSDSVTGQLISSQPSPTEPKLKITLFQAMVPYDKFETILQKGTEVGICQFVPVVTKRSLIKENNFKQDKVNRWHRIVQEAAEQSERGVVPEIQPLISYQQALEQVSNFDNTWIAWEGVGAKSLTDITPATNNLAIFVGPEGGFEDQEIELAQKYNCQLISLGPRVLRAETASISLASIALYQSADLNLHRIPA